MGPFVREHAFFVTHFLFRTTAALVLAAPLITSSTLVFAAEGGKDRDEQRTLSRPPGSFTTLVPVCYRKDDGRTRLVRPWNVDDLSTPTCRPPVPWDESAVPDGGW